MGFVECVEDTVRTVTVGTFTCRVNKPESCEEAQDTNVTSLKRPSSFGQAVRERSETKSVGFMDVTLLGLDDSSP